MPKVYFDWEVDGLIVMGCVRGRTEDYRDFLRDKDRQSVIRLLLETPLTNNPPWKVPRYDFGNLEGFYLVKKRARDTFTGAVDRSRLEKTKIIPRWQQSPGSAKLPVTDLLKHYLEWRPDNYMYSRSMQKVEIVRVFEVAGNF